MADRAIAVFLMSCLVAVSACKKSDRLGPDYHRLLSASDLFDVFRTDVDWRLELREEGPRRERLRYTYAPLGGQGPNLVVTLWRRTDRYDRERLVIEESERQRGHAVVDLGDGYPTLAFEDGRSHQLYRWVAEPQVTIRCASFGAIGEKASLDQLLAIAHRVERRILTIAMANEGGR